MTPVNHHQWRAAAGKLLAVALGLGLLLLAEGVIRFLPAGRAPALTTALAQDGGRVLHTINPDFAQRFIRGSVQGVSLEGFRMAPRPYLEPRRPETVRIVWVGGSTVQGYPYPRRLCAPAYLGAMLQDAWPHREVEVFNLGITAAASFVVARTAEQALDLKPDLLIATTGHNEFYGVYGAASPRQGGTAYWAKGLHYRLMQTGVAQVMRRALSTVRRGRPPDRSLLALMGTTGSVLPGDPRRVTAQGNLGRSLDQIATACEARGIPLVLTTLACNDTEFPPDTTADRQAWQVFERARSLRDAGRHVEARAAFVRARDLDPVPWRASAAFNDEIRSAASRHGALLADVAAAFGRASPGSGVGWELMADHLHPSTRGQVLMARTVVEALRGAPDQVGLPAVDVDRLQPLHRYPIVQGDGPVERFAVAQDMARLMEPPPLRRDGGVAARQYQARADSLYQTLGQPERNGLERWQRRQEPGPLALAVANQLFAAGQYRQAARHYWAARLEEPYTLWADLWATVRWGRCLEVDAGRLRPAEQKVVEAALQRARFLAQAPDLDPALVEFVEGYAMHLLGRHGEALEALQRCATQHDSVQRQLTYDLLALLSEELVRVGRVPEARRYIEEVTARVDKPALGAMLLGALPREAASAP